MIIVSGGGPVAGGEARPACHAVAAFEPRHGAGETQLP